MFISFKMQMLVYLLSAAMSVSMIFFFLIKGRKSALLYSFVIFQTVILVWLMRIISLKLMLQYDAFPGNFGDVSFDQYELYHFKLKHFVVCFTGLCWLVFCLLYSERDIKNDRKIFIFLILASPVVFSLPVGLYNAWNDHLSQYKTVLFWLHTVSRHTYYLAGSAILLRWCIRQKAYVIRSLLLALSIAFPVILNFLQDYKRFILLSGGIIFDFDVTPVGFIITMTVIAFIAYRYRFLDIVPAALKRIVDSMNQAIVVVDPFNRIVDYNVSFPATFEAVKNISRMMNFGSFLQELESVTGEDSGKKVLEMLRDGKIPSFKGEICIRRPENKYLAVELQSLNSKGKVLARVISFNDITAYKKLMMEINEKNLNLTAMYEQVREYASTVEELAIARERNRFAKDIHDTLGHTLTLLIALLEVSSITCGKDDEITRERLGKALAVSREGLKEIRRSISGLVPENLDPKSLVNSLDRLVTDFRSSGVSVDYTVDGAETPVERLRLEVLYRACQEAMTNSVRHGSARHIDVILKFCCDKLKLFVIDDGRGCKQIKKGFGLTGMEQRIESLGGKVVYGSDGESGFNIHIEVPLRKNRESFESVVER